MFAKRSCISWIVLCFLACGTVCSQDKRDSVRIHFKQGQSVLDFSVGKNREALERITERLKNHFTDSIYQLQSVQVIGGASPEGSVRINRQLSEKRANTLFDYLSNFGPLSASRKSFLFLGRDWQGLLDLVKQDAAVPYQSEVISFLQEVIANEKSGKVDDNRSVEALIRFKNGEPYRYMYKVLFPELRASFLKLDYEKIRNPFVAPPVVEVLDTVPAPVSVPAPIVVEPEPVVEPVVETPKPFYMAVRTNLLEDVLLVPNLGVEFSLGKRWSIGGNWMYAWWKNDRKHDYWRIYGGDLYVRKYFGKKAQEKPLQGHHIGLYGLIVTYDFERGGTGYMGGKPGGTLFDKFNYGGGIEYGYSLPIGKRLNLDFSIGIGYLGGEYHEYEPMDDCYVWQVTKDRHYWGPTKAEVSLVWLLGRGNVNEKKGGKR